MWLKKANATHEDYQQLCSEIERELTLPINFEGRYKWIVFLNSKVNPEVPVLNRYYGVFEDGTLKVRGIDLRRRDTPEIIRRCQTDMLKELTRASSSAEFKALIPETLQIMKRYASMIRMGRVPADQLIIEKRLSKMPQDYVNITPQALAAKHLLQEGRRMHAGESVSYLLTSRKARIPENRALPTEFTNANTRYDPEAYIELLLSSTMSLLLPFSWDQEALRRLL